MGCPNNYPSPKYLVIQKEKHTSFGMLGYVKIVWEIPQVFIPVTSGTWQAYQCLPDKKFA